MTLLATNASTDRVYKCAGFSGVIDESFSSPVALLWGVSWDSGNAITGDTTSGVIYRHTGFSASVSDSFSSPGGAPRGLSWDGTNLLSVDSVTNDYYKHTGFSSSLTDCFSTPGNLTSGIAWDGTNLLGADNTNGDIYRHQGFTSTIIECFSSPSSDLRDLAWMGDNLISGDATTEWVYKHDGFTSTIIETISIGIYPSGVEWATAEVDDFTIYWTQDPSDFFLSSSSSSVTSSSTSTTSSSSSSSTSQFLGRTWGYENPGQGVGSGWSYWKFKELPTQARYSADYGQLELGCGESFVSDVIDMHNTDSKTLGISFDDYDTGSGGGDIYWRGDTTHFNQDDDEVDGPAWVEYTGPQSVNWRYVQVMVT